MENSLRLYPNVRMPRDIWKEGLDVTMQAYKRQLPDDLSVGQLHERLHQTRARVRELTKCALRDLAQLLGNIMGGQYSTEDTAKWVGMTFYRLGVTIRAENIYAEMVGEEPSGEPPEVKTLRVLIERIAKADAEDGIYQSFNDMLDDVDSEDESVLDAEFASKI